MSNSKSILIIVLLVLIGAGLIGVNVYLWNYHSKLASVQPIAELTNLNSETLNTNQAETAPEVISQPVKIYSVEEVFPIIEKDYSA